MLRAIFTHLNPLLSLAGTKADILPMTAVLQECENVADSRTAPIKYLADLLEVPRDLDEWGNPSLFGSSRGRCRGVLRVL